MFKLDLEKPEESEIKLPALTGSYKKVENSRKTSASLTVLKPLTVWITRNYESHSVVSDSLQPHGLCSPWNSPGRNTGVGSCSLLQGIIPTQGSNPGLPHCRWILYQLSHQGSPVPTLSLKVACGSFPKFTLWVRRKVMRCS